MEIQNNTKAKRRSQGIAFGIFRLLSLCIVLILYYSVFPYYLLRFTPLDEMYSTLKLMINVMKNSTTPSRNRA